MANKDVKKKIIEMLANPSVSGGVGGTVIGGALPYATMRKKEGETDEQFKARRRGVASVGAVSGGVAGLHAMPLLTHGRLKTASKKKKKSYFEREQERAKADYLKQLQEELKNVSAEEFEKEKKRKEEGQRRRKAGFQTRGYGPRIAESAAGATLLAKNVPQLGLAKGRSRLYHGTGSYGLRGILGDDLGPSSVSGLSTRFSGTKGRLNAVQMPNAIIKAGLEGEFGLSEADVLQIQNAVSQRIRTNKGTPIGVLVRDTLASFGKDRGMPKDKIEALTNKSLTALKNAGMRIYFANSPDKVMTWSDDLNEMDKIVNAGVKSITGLDLSKGNINDQLSEMSDHDLIKQQLGVYGKGARRLLNTALGGGLDALKDFKEQKKYYDKLEVHDKKVSPEFIKDLARKADTGSGNFRFLLGADVPTEDVQMLADFKGISAPLRASPLLQSALSNLPGFEGYDPNRDLSTAKDIAMRNIKHVDVLDEGSGKLKRYFLDSFDPEKLSLGQRVKSVGQAAVPLAFAGLGANMLYRGMSGRRGKLDALVGKVGKKIFGKKKKDEQKKTASKAHYKPVMDGIKASLKYGLPLTALGVGSAVAVDKIGRKVLPVTEEEINPITLQDEIAKGKKEFARASGGYLAKGGVALGLGALGGLLSRRAGRKLVGNQLSEIKDVAERIGDANPQAAKNLMGFYNKAVDQAGGLAYKAGGQVVGAGTMLGALAAKKYENAARGDDPMREALGETREEIAKSPWKSAVVPTLATVAGLGIGTSAALKHYPGLIRQAKTDAVFGDKIPGMKQLTKMFASGSDLGDSLNITSTLLPKTTESLLKEYTQSAKKGTGIPPSVMKFVAEQAARGDELEKQEAAVLKNMLLYGDALSLRGAMDIIKGGGDAMRKKEENAQKAVDLLLQQRGKSNRRKLSEQILDDMNMEAVRYFSPTRYDKRRGTTSGEMITLPMSKSRAKRFKAYEDYASKGKTQEELKEVPKAMTEHFKDIRDALRESGLHSEEQVRKEILRMLKATPEIVDQKGSHYKAFEEIFGTD